MFFITLVVFLVILGLLVFVHELGHFVAAKLSEVRVDEFAFGFPPRIYCRKRGETRYCINLIPFGGYVKMLGEEEESKSPQSFSSKRARSKLFIVLAGVAMNFVLAGLLFAVGYMIGMSPIRVNPDIVGGSQANQIYIAQVNEGSPAASVGLQVGDTIEGFSSNEEFSRYTASHLGERISIDITRAGELMTKELTVSDNEEAPVGVGVVDIPTIKLGFFQAIKYGFIEMVLTTGYIFVMLKEVLLGLFSGHVSDSVAGPVGIFNLTGEAVKMGIVYIIQLTAILSINLGLINILPLPALDGGRAVFIFAEGVFRKKVVKAEVENVLHFVGFVLFIAAIVALTFREVIALI